MDKKYPFSVYFQKPVLIIFLLGFSSGLPLALTASTLDVWLTREGISLHSIGLFAIASLPYGLKFLWAPFMDSIRLPYFSKFGRRKSWILAMQGCLMVAIIALAFSNPAENIILTAALTFLTTFFSASQDIVIDAYRVQSLPEETQGAGAAAEIFGYRIGMLVSGAGSLYLVRYFGLPWHMVYMIMGSLIIIGMVTALLAKEPERRKRERSQHISTGSWKLRLKIWFVRAIIAPFADFMKKNNWILILLFIILYKLGDALAGKMTNPFLIKTGFNEVEIANVVKLYGFIATIFGTFLGGMIVYRIGVIKSLWLGGILEMISNFIFSLQAIIGHSVPFLSFTIGVENFCGGLDSIILVAYLSSLCNKNYTATQYALLSSLAVMGRTSISALSGFMAEKLGWAQYFMTASAATLPALVVLFFISRDLLFKRNTKSPSP